MNDNQTLTDSIEAAWATAISPHAEQSEGRAAIACHLRTALAIIDSSETYALAKNSGDKRFLRFIADRLVNVHGENPSVDYVLKLREFADAFDPLAATALQRIAGVGRGASCEPASELAARLNYCRDTARAATLQAQSA